jgi:formylglycine-generating enzyme required for sulfatase activity
MTRRGFLFAALFARHRGMVRLPGGTFRMGSDESTLARQFPNVGAGLKAMLSAETPAVEVTIPPFWMDRHEVTNAEFRSFVRARPAWRKQQVGGNYLQHWNGDEFPAGLAEFPVTFVTWPAALAFAEWAGKRLPTEAEWEFAARGGRYGARYPWGDEEPSPRRANYRDSGMHAPARVAGYAANPYGLFDLAGNVWEFCLDPWRDRHPAEAQRQFAADVRRLRDAKTERRVIRGGSFDGGAFNMRVTARDSHPADNPTGFVGFRCAAGAIIDG